MNFFNKLFKKKENPIETYQDFWQWFQTKEKTFFKAVKKHTDVDRDALSPIMEKLQMLDECFYCQIGMKDDNTADLVITVEGDIKSFVFVDELIAAAPKIDGWVLTNLKPADGIGCSINMNGYKFDKETISFYENVLPEYPDEIDITLVHKDLTETNKKAITNGTFIFLETDILSSSSSISSILSSKACINTFFGLYFSQNRFQLGMFARINSFIF